MLVIDIFSFAYRIALDTVLPLHITGPPNQLSKTGKVKKKEKIIMISTYFLNFAPTMIGGKENYRRTTKAGEGDRPSVPFLILC